MSTAEELRQEGNTAFNAKRYQEALTIYERAITLDPRNVDILNNASAASIALKNFNDAEKYARRSLDISDNARAHSRLGAALWGLNRLAEAAVEYERAEALMPDNSNVKESLQQIRFLQQQQQQQQSQYSNMGITVPPGLTGTVGLLLDTGVVVTAVMTLLFWFFAPGLNTLSWNLQMIMVMLQQGYVANTRGLLKASKEVLFKWGEHRCTLELLLCLLALLTGVRPIIMISASFGAYSAVSLANNQAALVSIAPAVHRLCLPLLQKIVTNQLVLVAWAVGVETILLFTIMLNGGAIFTLVYIQYIKNLYRIDANVKFAFSGVRTNMTRVARSPWMPSFVDTYLQKFCDALYMMSQQNY
ncbi:uncharacterized protein TM35_000041800 [Trypanosoma theileri]|uniref:Uncharacterized protein n=1 Tax=Trypanosoma theileri TaxID=67003 RepID=A0A1X0P4V4_9TRYP|nr:uncharacterized protein TM35_000041800 [Trypanosoma theileri]ORC91966.1 hypothetical protein TM35_000041800 [Trypanosoma theileri]